MRELLGPEPAYAVGGIVRDSILSHPPGPEGAIPAAAGNDWDIATPLLPMKVMGRLRKAGVTAVPVGIEHGTVAAVIGGEHYEITTFRHDVEYPDGRHPVVRFADNLEEDLRRRDFTINAFALDLDTGEVIDRFDGYEDLAARRVRTVGDPEERFREDHLRMARAARFAAKLQGGIEPETFGAIRDLAHLVRRVSAERIRDEIMKMLGYEKPSIGFVLLHETGLLPYFMPELEAGFGVWQNRFHADDVAMHTLHTVDALNPAYPFQRFTALMHDLGKVPRKMYKPAKGDYVFYGHQYASKRMTREIMRRLRFSNKEIEAASRIVENHMYNLKPDLSEGAIRRFVRKVGRDNLEGFLRVRMADRRGNRLNGEGYEKGLFHFVRTWRKIQRDDDALTTRDLKVSGHDLIDMGLRPGPVFAAILNQLLEEVLDDPARNEREWLLERAGAMADEYRRSGTIPPKPTAAEEDGGDGAS